MRAILLLFLPIILWTSGTLSAATLIRNVRIIDGNTAHEPTDILIDGSRIIQLGRVKDPSRQQQTVDAEGLYALPGLIDSHTHLASVPGANFRGITPSEQAQRQRIQLAACLASGVTTVLDAAIPEATLQMLQAYVEGSGLGPRIIALRPVLVAPGGYMGSPGFRQGAYAQLDAPVQSLADIEARLQQARRDQAFGVKMAVEDGFGPISNYVNFSDEERTLIAETAQKNNVKLFVHSLSDSEHRRALALKPYALLHAGYNESQPSETVLATLVERGTYVITTNAIYDLMGLMWDAGRVERDAIRSLIPAEQLATLKDPKAVDYVTRGVLQESLPSWLPLQLLVPFIPYFFNKKTCDDFLASSQRAIRLMHQKGVRLVMGSDSGNWPLFTSFFHGYGSIREMEVLLDAGLPPQDVIAAATSRAAAMLGLSHEIGSIAVGKQADIVLLRENPLASKTAYRSIKAVMKAGVIKSPEEWMRAAYDFHK